MCLIFIALKKHARYKLIIAANRDEFYNRKTAAADFWTDHQDVLGGRDLEAGGTWLGINRNGKLAMVTNFRDPKKINPEAPSRGALVSDFLTSQLGPAAYLEQLRPAASRYNGFNLLVGGPEGVWYFSNYAAETTELKEGVYGLSNHLLETPWPKVKRGKQKLLDLLENGSVDVPGLFGILFDDVRAADEVLPDTGVGIERERALSSMFIRSPGYGTRCSTVILIDHDNHVTFSERVFNLQTFAADTRNFSFQIVNPALV
jgi:uncharacterized protein with NRDE domain